MTTTFLDKKARQVHELKEARLAIDQMIRDSAPRLEKHFVVCNLMTDLCDVLVDERGQPDAARWVVGSERGAMELGEMLKDMFNCRSHIGIAEELQDHNAPFGRTSQKTPCVVDIGQKDALRIAETIKNYNRAVEIVPTLNERLKEQNIQMDFKISTPSKGQIYASIEYSNKAALHVMQEVLKTKMKIKSRAIVDKNGEHPTLCVYADELEKFAGPPPDSAKGEVRSFPQSGSVFAFRR